MLVIADRIGATRIGNVPNTGKVYNKRGRNVTPTQPAIISIPNHTPFWSMKRARGISVKSGKRLPTAKPTKEHSKSTANNVTVIAIKVSN